MQIARLDSGRFMSIYSREHGVRVTYSRSEPTSPRCSNSANPLPARGFNSQEPDATREQNQTRTICDLQIQRCLLQADGLDLGELGVQEAVTRRGVLPDGEHPAPEAPHADVLARRPGTRRKKS